MENEKINENIIEKDAEKKGGFKAFLTKLVTPESKKGLIVRIVLGLLIPYAYLYLCGLVFDTWLHAYNMVTFVFFSYVTFQLLGIAFAIVAIVKNSKRKKQGK